MQFSFHCLPMMMSWVKHRDKRPVMSEESLLLHNETLFNRLKILNLMYWNDFLLEFDGIDYREVEIFVCKVQESILIEFILCVRVFIFTFLPHFIATRFFSSLNRPALYWQTSETSEKIHNSESLREAGVKGMVRIKFYERHKA